MKVGDLVQWDKTSKLITEKNEYKAIRIGKVSGIIISLTGTHAKILSAGSFKRKKLKKLTVINERG
jgi:hypothetical protein